MSFSDTVYILTFTLILSAIGLEFWSSVKSSPASNCSPEKMSTDGGRECPPLPSEIVEKILEMVMGSACKASDFFRLRQVCKQWRDCADDILVSFEKRRSGHCAILFWFSLLLVNKLTCFAWGQIKSLIRISGLL